MHYLQGTREGEMQQMLWLKSTEFQGKEHVNSRDINKQPFVLYYFDSDLSLFSTT
jgi:hypothetical protein